MHADIESEDNRRILPRLADTTRALRLSGVNRGYLRKALYIVENEVFGPIESREVYVWMPAGQDRIGRPRRMFDTRIEVS